MDARTDIFAFGCVLYELITGQRAFDGKSASSIMASVLATTPKPDRGAGAADAARAGPGHLALPREGSGGSLAVRSRRRRGAAVDRAGRIEGRPAGRRHREAQDARAPRVGRVRAGDARGDRLRGRVGPPRAAAAARRPVPAAAARRAHEPDVAGSVARRAQHRVHRHRRRREGADLGAGARRRSQPRALPGTDGARRLFWAPDSRQIAFTADGKLRKVDIAGGPPQTICESPTGSDGSWSPEGVILFDGQDSDPIWEVPASGGIAKVKVPGDPKKGITATGWPSLPARRQALPVHELRQRTTSRR